ncbi:MAG: ABC transporter substrate-binding protein [Treponema sp.]|jgi:raffinose/stachyose/melibiose transport system substrate-binding protein|nr:ABC transporter substrate-binding protein [Treponema sp.]
MKKILLLAALVAVCAGLAFAGGKSQSASSTSGVIEVTIPHYKSGQNVGALYFLPAVERFNQKYAGKYKLIIEELVQDMYGPKMQQLSQQGQLPVLIEGGFKEWLEELIIPGNMFADLKPWLDSKPALKDSLRPVTLDYNTRGGKVFSVSYPVVRPVGIYYNAKLYTPSRPFSQLSWDQVLAEFGSNKIAFMTGENAWTTVLIFSSLIAKQPGGVDVLAAGEDVKITDFNTPIFINAATQLQQIMQKYASSNTLGAAYADAANNFMSAQSAMISNGSWMVGDFKADQSAKWSNGFSGGDVHADVLPGNVAIEGSGRGYGWWIPATATAAEQELGKAFLEHLLSPEELETYMLLEGGSAPRMTPSQSFLTERAKDRLLDEYAGAVKSDTILCPGFAGSIPTSVAESGLGRILPLLINGTYTPARFCQELTTMAKEAVR